MKRFCDDLNEHITRISNYEMKPVKKNHMKIKSYVIYAIKSFVPIIMKK